MKKKLSRDKVVARLIENFLMGHLKDVREAITQAYIHGQMEAYQRGFEAGKAADKAKGE